jgi:hypothetical protein
MAILTLLAFNPGNPYLAYIPREQTSFSCPGGQKVTQTNETNQRNQLDEYAPNNANDLYT